jgi:hypothetical protein
VTNTNLKAGQIIEHYKELWSIEKAFRISKTEVTLPNSQQIATIPIITDNEQSEILEIFSLSSSQSINMDKH